MVKKPFFIPKVIVYEDDLNANPDDKLIIYKS